MKIIYTVFMCLLGFSIQAQDVSRSVIASDGGSTSTSELSIDWTLGALISGTIQTGEGYLTQGFQQPNITVTKIVTVTTAERESLQIEVYPNPFIAELQIKLSNDELSQVSYQLIDEGGRLIRNKTMIQANEVSIVALPNLPAGVYFLNFISDNDEALASYQVVKSN